jgi:hypothetical protein
MLCVDGTVNYLRTFGYNVIRLPKSGVAPLQLYASDGRTLESLGNITTVFEAGAAIALPKTTGPVAAANFSGRRTSKLDASLGLELLGTIVGAMGGAQIGLKPHYQTAKSVVFQFGEVTEASVEVAGVDQYLTNGRVSPYSTYVSQLLDADDVYVTTGVLYATTLLVTAETKSSVGVEVDVPAVQAAVGTKVEVSAAATSSATVSFAGKEPLAFGFRAVRLLYDDGSYHALGKLPAKTTMRAVREPPADTGMLLSPTAFVRLAG